MSDDLVVGQRLRCSVSLAVPTRDAQVAIRVLHALDRSLD
jgi:hypothetical protein